MNLHPGKMELPAAAPEPPQCKAEKPAAKAPEKKPASDQLEFDF